MFWNNLHIFEWYSYLVISQTNLWISGISLNILSNPPKVTLKKILLDRVGNGNRGSVFQRKIGEFASKDTSNEELAAKVLKRYKGKMSSNVKKVGKWCHIWVLFVNKSRNITSCICSRFGWWSKCLTWEPMNYLATLPANPFAIPQARWMFQLGIFTLLSNSPFYYNPMPKSSP